MFYAFSRVRIKKVVHQYSANVKKIGLLGFILLLLPQAIFSILINPVVATPSIYINPDGSVTGTDKIQQSGNIYTFVENINDSIVVQRNNIVLDGAGFTLQGPGGINSVRGVVLNGISNVTIKNMKVADFYYGIELSGSSNNNIQGTEITGSTMDGIRLYQSSNYNNIFENSLDNYNGITITDSLGNIVSNNSVTKLWNGIIISYSSSNSLFGNNITGGLANGVSFQSSDNNTFFENRVESGSDGISLVNSEHNEFYENKISGTSEGIRLSSSSSNTFFGNWITGYVNGAWLSEVSDNNTIYGNNITGHFENGMGLVDSYYCNISGNNVTGSALDGILLSYSLGNTVSGNNVTSNHENGISLQDSNNNTIDGNKIANNWQHGITLVNSINNNLDENIVTNNGIGILAGDYSGILISFSNNNTLFGNQITENDCGINIQSSSENTLRNNNASDNKYNFGVYSSSFSHCIQDVDDSNIVNGKPVYYWINKENMAVPSDAGYVALVNCSDIIVQNLKLEKNWQGVLLAFTTNSTVNENEVLNNLWGIELDYSSNYNTVSGNNITNNDDGLWLYKSSSNNSIYRNRIVNNAYGIRLSEASSNVIARNNIMENGNQGIWLNYSSSNIIYHNNFVDNTEQVLSLNSTNAWEGGSPYRGNFWSDYIGVDEDSDGVGDTPYVIDTMNQDHQPAMSIMQEEYLLTVNLVGSGSISLNVSGPYVYGSVVELTAIPEGGWSFYEWSGDLSGSAITETIIMTDDKFVTATFQVINSQPHQPQLSISPSIDVKNEDDLKVTVIGPTPADPDGDVVTYTYRWQVNLGEGFFDDEAVGREDHIGNVVPSADTVPGDIWRVEVTPVDEHGSSGTSRTVTWLTVVGADTASPVADAGSDKTVFEDRIVNFNGGGSTDNVGVASYMWNFGDGITGTGVTVTHTYSNPGTYTVTLTVKDSAGNSDTDSLIVTVKDDTEESETAEIADSDGDGVDDDEDAFPLDPKETVDTDSDGVGNNADTDDDNDGFSDDEDAFPLDSLESLDSDEDGIGNNADLDDDNDGVPDVDDAFPLDALEFADTDADGVGNVADNDDDGDGLPDEWEKENGLDPLDALDASFDDDGNGLTVLQEYELNLYPDDLFASNVRTFSVLTGVVVGSIVATAAVLTNLASFTTSFDSAISKLPIPDELKEFLQLYGEKLFETVDKAKLEVLEKAPFIGKREVAALGASALIATIVIGSDEAGGLQNLLTYTGLANFIPLALVAVFTVIIFSELFETCCARCYRVHKQFKLWMYGTVMFLVSGLVFGFPIGSPGITRYRSGEISDKAKGLFVLSKMFLLLTLMIPFAGLLMLGFNIVGAFGLWLTLITVFSSLIPVKPLVGKALFNYRKDVSLVALLSSGLLLFSFVYSRVTNVIFLPFSIYLIVGAVSAVLAGFTLNQLRKTQHA